MEVDKVHAEIHEWQRLIDHQRAAISLQETKVESAASTVDVVTKRNAEAEAQARQMQEGIAVKDKTIEHLHAREENAKEQIRAIEHLHHRSQKSCAELEARVVVLERQCAGLSDQLNEKNAEVRAFAP